MLLLDNLAVAPFKGLMWVFEQINAAVQQERAGERAGITRSLGELYMDLETGAITEAQFEAAEKRLLDRLDAIESHAANSSDITQMSRKKR